LDFMMEHDLHPGRPGEVLYCVDCYADLCCRSALRTQLGRLYSLSSAAHDRKVG